METGGWVGLASGAIVAGFTVLSFWLRFSDRITKAHARADAAMVVAEEARAEAKEGSEKTTLLSASFGIYREQVAREYIHREVMREVEERLTSAIDRLGDRLDRVLERSELNHQSHRPSSR